MSDSLGANELHMAASKGDVDSFKRLLKVLEIDCPDATGRTALMYAALANQPRACRYLIKGGANVNARDENGNTALLLTAMRGNADVCKVLLKADSNVDGADRLGRSAVHWGAKCRSPSFLEAFLPAAFRTLVNRKDDEQLTPLHWAAISNHAPHTRLLLAHQCDPSIGDGDQRTPLHYAISRGNLEVAEMLLSSRPELVNVQDSSGRSALHVACGEGSTDSVMMLLRVPGVNVAMADCRLTTPLHWASVCNRPDVCEALVESGAPLAARDMQGLTPIHYAHKKGHTECVSVLHQYATMQAQAQSRPTTSASRRTSA